ncbi:metallopeptidase TldD-related protein [Citroniella saccharovorans]|uniref:Metallopeptidase TldD-related protein n=1 Tax=Citroniella saccharovorans TaxID=2053367 RepID=A0AAW9MQF5_9FIRM|nr:metallopeptidase TldD-related protein [Citroniella saccharovorans]MEB3429334.1 metallopeptidase TldD-related protein [Citroniella saccharovorans]
MLDTIKEILDKKDISFWTINESISKSEEVFLIKNKTDLSRITDVHEFEVNVYKDFEDNGNKTTSSGTVTIGISESKEEIEKKIDELIYSLNFVKNEAYTFSFDPVQKTFPKNELKKLRDSFRDIYDVIYKDYKTKSKVNSIEIFLYNKDNRVLNKSGVDVKYSSSKLVFELVTENNLGSEPVEIFRGYEILDIDLKRIEEITKNQLEETDARAIAVRNNKISGIDVILSGDDVEDFFSFFLTKTSASSIYEKLSDVKIGDKMLDDNAKTKLNIKLDPNLSHSPYRRPVDSDGTLLNEVNIMENGKILNLSATQRYASYLDIKATGDIQTFTVGGGEKPIEDFKKGDYLEILHFSSFNLDPFTGDFGGEFRLAKLVQDGKVSFVTGGSISENIMNLRNDFYISKETENRLKSKAPKAVIFKNLTVGGIEK